jgi:hypothetical protein
MHASLRPRLLKNILGLELVELAECHCHEAEAYLEDRIGSIWNVLGKILAPQLLLLSSQLASDLDLELIATCLDGTFHRCNHLVHVISCSTSVTQDPLQKSPPCH